MEERVPTGIEGLDELIEGGFPRGSLILLAGNPGTGKTIFGMQFLYHGARDYGEKGVYVSFAESRDVVTHNISKVLGFNVNEKLEDLKILDFTTVTEKGLPTMLEMIVHEITSLNAKRLVIDSFSAIAQACKESIEARSILHNIFTKLVRQMGCTTILIVEVPMGSKKLGIGVEEFVADGVIVLKKNFYNDMLLREIEIRKLRGTRLKQQKFLFTLSRGFHVFTPFRMKKFENTPKFEAQMGSKTHYPSGIPELDEILGGSGYPRGSSVLYELGENVPYEALDAIIFPTIANFLLRGRGFMIVPPIGRGPEEIKEKIISFVSDESKLNQQVKILVFPNPLVDESKPYVVIWKDPLIERLDPIQNLNLYLEKSMDLANKLRKNVLHVLSVDNLTFLVWGTGPMAFSAIGRSVVANKYGKDLMLYVATSSSHETIRILADILNMHFKLEEKNGTIIFYGKKPKTIIYVIEQDITRGCLVRLIPIL
ncbi:MAG: ATPase domain-containing protein [Candidatus Bathyarchaeia archaeon]